MCVKGSDFTEQLDVLRQQFRDTTDRLINSIETAYDTLLVLVVSSIAALSDEASNQGDCSSPPASSAKRRVSVFGQAISLDPKILVEADDSEPDDELYQEMRRL